jgi:hypothetical protein
MTASVNLSSHRFSSRLIGIVVSIGLAVVVAACGSGVQDGTAADDGKVASLATESAGASEKPQAGGRSDPADERPLIRTDTSAEDEKRFYDQYQRCLKEHGDPRLQVWTPGDMSAPRMGPAREGDPPAAVAAAKDCVGKLPETVVDRAQRVDPAYTDKLRDWVTCLRAGGIDAQDRDGELSLKELPTEEQRKKIEQCQDKIFGVG